MKHEIISYTQRDMSFSRMQIINISGGVQCVSEQYLPETECARV